MSEPADELKSLFDLSSERAVDEQRARRSLRERSAATRKNHADRAAQIEQNLSADSADAGPQHALLLHLAADQAALAQELGELQVQLVGRAHLLLDSPASALKVAKALKELTVVASAIGGRVESLLGTASLLRAQRALTSSKRPGLRAA